MTFTTSAIIFCSSNSHLFSEYLKAVYKQLKKFLPALLREDTRDTCLAGMGTSTKGRTDLSEYMQKSSPDNLGRYIFF